MRQKISAGYRIQVGESIPSGVIEPSGGVAGHMGRRQRSIAGSPSSLLDYDCCGDARYEQPFSTIAQMRGGGEAAIRAGRA